MTGVEDDTVAERDAAFLCRLEPRDAAQGRRLAATARTEKDEELALFDLEVEVVDRRHRGLPRETFRQASDVDVGHFAPPRLGVAGGRCAPARLLVYGWKRAFQLAWKAATFAGVKFESFWLRGVTYSVPGAPGMIAPPLCWTRDWPSGVTM